MSSEAFMFEKVFFQAAHISILDLALQEARKDIYHIRDHIDLNQHEVGRQILKEAIQKIDIAYRSIEKLKAGGAI